MKELKELITTISSPRLYLQIGKYSLARIVGVYVIIILATLGVPKEYVFLLVGCASIPSIFISAFTFYGKVPAKYYKSIMDFCLIIMIITSLYTGVFGYNAFNFPVIAAITLTGISVLTTLGSALTRTSVQEKGEDAGLTLMQILIPVFGAISLIFAGILADIKEQYVFFLAAMLSCLILFFQLRHTKAEKINFPRLKLSSKARRLLLLDVFVNSAFTIIHRSVIALYLVSFSESLGIDTHTFKFFGFIMSLLMMCTLLYNALKARFNKWQLNGRKLMYIGVFGYALCIVTWGIFGLWGIENTQALFTAIVLLWGGMQVLAPIWNVGFFGELKKSVPENVENKNDTYQMYNQAFGVAINTGVFLGGLLAAYSITTWADKLDAMLVGLGSWALIVALVYTFFDCKERKRA